MNKPWESYMEPFRIKGDLYSFSRQLMLKEKRDDSYVTSI